MTRSSAILLAAYRLKRSHVSLSQKQSDPRWDFLGVVPIVYSADDDHAALSKGLEEWVELSKMGTLDHEQRIRKIASASPPLDPQEADYIRGVFQDPAKLQFFTRYASSEEWLEWTEQQEAFKWLFRPELGSNLDPERPITQVAAAIGVVVCAKFRAVNSGPCATDNPAARSANSSDAVERNSVSLSLAEAACLC